jgi:hypothetical protein
MTRAAAGGGSDLRTRLRELIAAIDRRIRQPGRRTEARIAAEAAALRQKAQQRIADLDAAPHGR